MYQGSILLCQADFYLDIGGNLHHHHQESDLTEDYVEGFCMIDPIQSVKWSQVTSIQETGGRQERPNINTI